MLNIWVLGSSGATRSPHRQESKNLGVHVKRLDDDPEVSALPFGALK